MAEAVQPAQPALSAGTVVTVQGEAEARRTAERARVHLSATANGPQRDPVVDATASAAAAVTALLQAQHDPENGPVVRWQSDRARVWSDRPWNQAGKQLPLVYHATVSITAEFSDVEALSRFVETASRTEHVSVSGIGWDLTEATRLAVEAEVREEAVRLAVAKARQFAAAVGLSEVAPVAIADPGLLGDGGGRGDGGGMLRAGATPMMARAAVADDAPSFDFTPGELVVRAAVDARFLAR